MKVLTQSQKYKANIPNTTLSWSTKSYYGRLHLSPCDLRLFPTHLPFSVFARVHLNEVSLLRLKLQMSSKRSSIKFLPSSAPHRNLRHTNFIKSQGCSDWMALPSRHRQHQREVHAWKASVHSERWWEWWGQRDKDTYMKSWLAF